MDETKFPCYKNLCFSIKSFIILNCLILLFYSCNNGNEIPNLEVPQNTDSLAIELYKSDDYLKFINTYIIPRERNSNVYLYENKILDISFVFKRIGEEIIVQDEIAIRLDSLYENNWRNELVAIKDICNSMERYSINSFWGVFADTSAEKLAITFSNFEQVYFRINDSSYNKNLNLRLSDTVYYDKQWVLLK